MKRKKIWTAVILSFMLAGTVSCEGISDPEIASKPISKISDKVSMDFENASLKNILKAFSIQTGINFIAI